MRGPLSSALLAGSLAALLSAKAEAQGTSLRFFGNGVAAPELDRVKVRIDAPARPADIGATDFTIELWMKASAAENTSGPCSSGGDAWINGNILMDRDVFNAGDYGDYGIALYGGRIAFGVATQDGSDTICSTANVANGVWHHVALTRRFSDGQMRIFVDGQIQAAVGSGPSGDASYRDGRPTSYPNSDPFIVFGAEKHDAGAAYPSYSGGLDEVRLSTTIRYTASFTPPTQPFATDASTAALYHFDEGSGTAVNDSAGAPGGPSNGVLNFGGSPAGPLWSTDTPFGATTPADLALIKTGPASVTPGQTIVYTITVTNNGPGSAASVVVGDGTPAGLTFVSNSGSCATAFPCALGTIGTGQNRTITSTFRVSSGYAGPSPLQNTAGIVSAAPDPTPANNTSTASTLLTPPLADLAITKTGPLAFSPAATLIYTLTVTNTGPSDAATALVTDPTPTDLVFVSNAGSCTTAFPCSLGTIPGGQARTITTTFAVPSGYSGPDPIVNSASVSTPTADPVSTNDSATATTPRSVPSSFHTVTPCRLVDTRGASGPALAAGAARTFLIEGQCAIPTSARAVSVNLAVTSPTAAGNLRLYPSGTPPPLASALNYSAGQTRANNAIVPLSGSGHLDVRCTQASGTVHFILDVNGWFE